MTPETPKKYASPADKSLQDRFRAEFAKQAAFAPAAPPTPAAESTLEQQIARSIADLADDFRL